MDEELERLEQAGKRPVGRLDKGEGSR